ncbi:sulfate adenylyltransferase subunit CysN [Pseudidiomarina mangrovi]|uniref:sulfate adenylyltransferase subunit CysN n=1 Tax=Pseudidiomarina mangrovi TaxID=2487133 RepID=UPI000FCB7605|nr:sulfate adenylyltransferase subunit CysN [Pseudidiomarina mangrovi]
MSHASPLIEQDILRYLEQHENKELVSFITCGSVDDGKSTLIGRLLHDSKLIYEDQLAAIKQASKGASNELDLSLLVDGLQAEREQGITIDVAYRYFSTDKRKFIIADTPGHEQYTRNMATGASTCDLAIILIDASRGVQTQTRRHSYIVSLLGIQHVIVAVNKMDLVGYSQQVYKAIQDDYLKLAGQLNSPDIYFVPISALAGDNIVTRSSAMDWFRGRTLMDYLETISISSAAEHDDFRFQVQYVNRPNADFRGYAGSISSGQIRVGETIRVMPSGKISIVKEIVTFDGSLAQAQAPQAITLTLNDAIDISRGDMIVKKNALPHSASNFRAKVVWMHEQPLEIQRSYYIKLGSKLTSGEVDMIHYRVDVNSLNELPAERLELNEIGLLDFSVQEPVVFDKYPINRKTGAFIIIDRVTHATVGAGMIEQPLVTSSTVVHQTSAFERWLNRWVRRHFPHWGAKEIS